jgi:hypothetical protein
MHPNIARIECSNYLKEKIMAQEHLAPFQRVLSSMPSSYDHIDFTHVQWINHQTPQSDLMTSLTAIADEFNLPQFLKEGRTTLDKQKIKQKDALVSALTHQYMNILSMLRVKCIASTKISSGLNLRVSKKARNEKSNAKRVGAGGGGGGDDDDDEGGDQGGSSSSGAVVLESSATMHV